jgi:hypothetical protein
MLLDRSKQRGSATVVVLVLTLVLLIVFVVLWFMEKDDREKAQKASAESAKTAADAGAAATKFRDGWETLSRSVGALKPLAEQLPANDPARQYASSAVVSDMKVVDANRAPDGMVEGEGGAQQPGFLNWLKQNTSVEIQSQIRNAKGEGVTEAKADFSWMKPEFKQKVAEVQALADAIGAAPSVPADDDDEAAKAEYAAKLKEYDDRVAAYRKGAEELTQMEGYKQWSQIVKLPGALVDENQVVKLSFFTEPAQQQTLLDLLAAAKGPITALESEYRKNKEADAARVVEVTNEKTQLEEQLAARVKDLEAEQARHTTDVNNLQQEVTAANAKVEANRLEATNAQSHAAQLEEEKKREEAQSRSKVSALEERIRQDKAKRDLAIRRDDPDGHILASNLSRMAKAYPGLKFAVSRIGRGGMKTIVGEVMILRVTGDHSSEVTILSQNDDNPVVGGDTISNPFYSPTETIHVYFAGDLERYPKSVAASRLARMGAVVDDQISGTTDFVVIPDSMSAPKEAPAAEGGEAPAPAAAGQSPLQKLEATAHTFGATVITEKMLNEFLDY